LRANTALCLYSYTYTEAATGEAPNSTARIECFLSVTAITSAEAAQDAARKVMQALIGATWKATWVPLNLGQRPDQLGLGTAVNIEYPNDAWNARNVVQRIMSVTMSEGEDGLLDWACDFGKPSALPVVENVNRKADKALGGTLNGAANIANPVTGGW
jgi:hypothetical protein